MALSDFVTARLSKPASRVLDAPIRDAIHEILREAGYASPAELQHLRDELKDLRDLFAQVEKRATDLASQLSAARQDADPRVATLATTLVDLELRTNARISALEAQVGALQPAAAPMQLDDGRLSTLEAQIAGFPSMVEQRLAMIEARITVLPAGIENRLDDLEARLVPTTAGFCPTPDHAEVADAYPDVTPIPAEAFAEALASSEETPAPLSAAHRPDCKVDGCDKANRSRGFCSSHYQQWRRGTLKGFLSPEGTVLVDGRIISAGVERAADAYTVIDGKVYVEGALIG